MTKDEALKLALELKNSASAYWTEKEISIIEKLIDALAQSEQEPVATMKMLHTYGDTTPPQPEQPNDFHPDWDAMAVMVEEQQRMAKRIAELEAQPEQEPVSWEDVLGAIARGWTHDDNKHKTMDVQLAVAIAKEIQDMVIAPPQRKPEQKYRRGNRLICLETEEYCVIHISGTDRQWITFPDSHIGVYTNAQVAELFELLPKEQEQEPVAWLQIGLAPFHDGDVIARTIKPEKWNPEWWRFEPLYTSPPQRPWVDLSDSQIEQVYYDVAKLHRGAPMPWGQVQFGNALQALVKEKNT